jgi:hypothetical protein
MANAVYPLYKSSILKESDTNNGLDVNTTTNGPYVALLDSGVYTYSASHQFKSDLTGIIAGGTPPTGRIVSPTVGSVAAGVFDGCNVTFTAVTTPTSIEAFAIFRNNSGANTTWRLVLYENTSVTGLPVTPNGGDITVSWNASGILLI